MFKKLGATSILCASILMSGTSFASAESGGVTILSKKVDWEVAKTNKISGNTVYLSGSHREPTDESTKYVNWSRDIK